MPSSVNILQLGSFLIPLIPVLKKRLHCKGKIENTNPLDCGPVRQSSQAIASYSPQSLTVSFDLPQGLEEHALTTDVDAAQDRHMPARCR